ncbi:hypothetical protein M0R45_024428 [Rubus argutus]|uniref:Uncharacterized protein n=1 Tax=Rubus argutus TaxID=59490 RepID=A0AAW1WT49_RUBAR
MGLAGPTEPKVGNDAKFAFCLFPSPIPSPDHPPPDHHRHHIPQQYLCRWDPIHQAPDVMLTCHSKRQLPQIRGTTRPEVRHTQIEREQARQVALTSFPAPAFTA